MGEVVFSADGRHVAISAIKDGTEAFWDVSFSPDGKLVGYGVKTGQELIWKVEKL